MEPVTENRPTLKTAEAVGAQRMEKVMKWVNRLAAPDILIQIGANAAKDKVDEVREKIENKATEIKDALVEKIMPAYERFEARFNAAKDKTVAVGKELGRRAKIVGLTPVAAGEAVWVEVYKLPALFRESIAEMKEKKADNYAAKLTELRKSSRVNREKAAEGREKARKKTVARRALERVRAQG